MTRRNAFFTALAVAAFSLGTAAQAGTMVLSDSGSVGSFSLTNVGVSGNVSTVSLAFLPTPPNSTQKLTQVNADTSVNIPAQFDSPIMLMFTNLGGGNFSVSSPSIMKTFGTGGAATEAQLMFNLNRVVTVTTGFLNLAGFVTSVMTNNLPGYDFTPFAGGGGTNNLTMTSSGSGSFLSVLTTAGASLTGSGSFAESVPEPASMALLGIGLSGLLTFRRFFKRISVA